MTRRAEAGQAAVLVIGLAVVVLLTVAVAVDASAAYLRRQGLDNLADGAALAAADGVQGRQVYVSGLGERARIDPRVARARVVAYLLATGATRHYPGLRHAVAVVDDRVVVRVEAPLDLPLRLPGFDDRTTVSATAASFVAVSD